MEPGIESLLSPISETQPTGPWREADPQVESAFYEAKERLLAAREITRGRRERDLGLEGDERRPRSARWDLVVSACRDLLQNHTKDAEVVAWLIEARGHEQGVLGIAEGLKLGRVLSEELWDEIHPTAEDEGDAGPLPRLGCFLALDERNARSELRLPLGDVLVTRAGAYTFAQARIAHAMETASAAVRSAWLEQGYPAPDHLSDAIRETGLAFYEGLDASIDECMTSLRALEEVLSRRAQAALGRDAAVAFPNIRNDLTGLKDLVASATEMLGSAPGPRSEFVAASDPSVESSGDLSRIASRQDAVRGLDSVAAYYRMHEPQSPLLCVVEQAVRWARLEAAELFEQVISPGSALHVLIAHSCSSKGKGTRAPRPPPLTSLPEPYGGDPTMDDSGHRKPATSLSRIARRLS